ncbi:MAG TPA: TIM barrel protein [Methylomirabilota bacterium]|nr:TIM barrel protein [Methylomirabilota bacterium]
MILSPCLEWLFADGGRPFPERIRAAGVAGFSQVEFWTTNDKDVEQVDIALRETAVAVTCFVSEPAGRLVDSETHAAFLRGVEQSTELAARLNTRNLIVVSGDARPGVERSRQRDAITEALLRAAPIASKAGVRLLLEPLNTRVDHPGYFLDSTAEALEVINDVDDPAVRLLYDLYHSIVMGEDPQQVLAGSGHLVGHVHVADVPGRHEPGTGTIDWPLQLAALRSAEYSGAIGLEYKPSRDTESSLELIRQLNL